jgi:hypothetical protein
MFQLEVADHTSGAQAGSRKRNQCHLATAPRVSFQQHLAPRDTRPPDENGREMIGEGERASGVWSERKRPLPCTSGIKTAKGNQTPGALSIASHVLIRATEGQADTMSETVGQVARRPFK